MPPNVLGSGKRIRKAKFGRITFECINSIMYGMHIDELITKIKITIKNGLGDKDMRFVWSFPGWDKEQRIVGLRKLYKQARLWVDSQKEEKI